MANMTVNGNIFELPINVESNGIINKVLKTADTYIDKNIKVTVTTPDAELEVKNAGVISAEVNTTDTTYTSDTVTNYPITIAADAKVTDVVVGVKTAGFAATSDQVTVAGSSADQVTKTIYIKEGALGGTGSAGAEGNISLTKVSEQPTTGYYVKASGAGNVTVQTAGWVDPAHTTAVTTDGDAYYTVKNANLTNTEATPDNFTEANAPVLTEDGYLFIEEGYIPNTKISLATLVPDDANITHVDGNNDLMYKTLTAYDKDGKLIAGTMDDAELGDTTFVLNSIDNNDYPMISTAGTNVEFKFDLAVKGTTSSAITKRGLATTDLSKETEVTGNTTYTFTTSKVGLGATANVESLSLTPIVEKSDATTAKTGTISTTAPTTGYYVAVETNALDTNTITVTPSVTTSGYGFNSLGAAGYNTTAKNVNVDVNGSGIYYISLNEGSHIVTKNASDVSAPVATVTTKVDAGDITPVTVAEAAKETGKKYVQIDATATAQDGYVQTNATCVATEGYITANTQDVVTKETVSVADASATALFIKVYDGEIIAE